MKSITPVISVILLIMLTIAVSAAAYFFVNSTTNDLQSQSNLDNYPGSDNSILNLVSITGSKAIVRNDGSILVTEVVMFVNGELLNYTLDTPIQPGELREITFNSREAGEDLEIKVIYNNGKTTQVSSPANLNTENSGFTESPAPLNEEEPEILGFLRVNEATIVEKSYGLEGYCNATSDNSNDLIKYNYIWNVGENIINNIEFKQSSIIIGDYFSCGIFLILQGCVGEKEIWAN